MLGGAKRNRIESRRSLLPPRRRRSCFAIHDALAGAEAGACSYRSVSCRTTLVFSLPERIDKHDCLSRRPVSTTQDARRPNLAPGLEFLVSLAAAFLCSAT